MFFAWSRFWSHSRNNFPPLLKVLTGEFMRENLCSIHKFVSNRLLVNDRSHFLNSVTWTTGKIFEHFKFLTFSVLPLLPQIHASFVCFVLLFLFHYETTTKAKFIYTLKKLTVEPEIKSMKMGWIRVAMKLLEKSVR